MKKNSIWESYLDSNFNELNKNIECDVLIIGGGIAGILTSYYLNNSNLNIVLVERNKILSGITSKMTAKVTLLQDILTKINKNDLELYIKSQLDGINLLKNNINKLNIKCNFKENESYLYTTKESNINKLKKLNNIFNKLNIPIKNENIPIKELNSLYSINTNLSYEVNPIKYLNGIINNLDINIYENTNIIKVINKDNYYYSKTSNNNTIKSKIVIFATNYPYFIKPLFFPIKVRLEKSNISYGKSKYIGKYNLINIDKNIYSIRFYNNKMIYLDNNHYLSHYKNNNKENFLINDIENNWTNMDIITNDYLPIIGKFNKNMYIITGFNTWGILSSHIGALLISDLINNKNNKYKELFDPRKKITIQKSINSIINVYESINGYYKGIIGKNNIDKICPHALGNLIYNKEENTWDCPCHGSRFDLNGNVISGPSKKKCKFDKKM